MNKTLQTLIRSLLRLILRPLFRIEVRGAAPTHRGDAKLLVSVGA